MPTYDYECQKCGHHFEKFQSMSDPVLKTCPECKGKVKRLIGSGAGLHFKGEGFYITDYRSKSYQEQAKSDAAGASKSADSGAARPDAAAKDKSDATGVAKPADSGATGGGKGTGPEAKGGGATPATPRSGSTSARKASSGPGSGGGTGKSGRSRKPSN